MLTLRMLDGHKASVSCLEAGVDDNVLISGSDDRSVRIWDVRSNKAVKCILGCFTDSIETLKLRPNGNTLFVGSGKSVFSFDMRHGSVLQREYTSTLQIASDGDEVGTIAVSPNGESVAVSDGLGCITVIPVSGNGVFYEHCERHRQKRLCRVHTNIISSVLFKASNPRELLSGGFDYISCVWDVDRCRPKYSTTIQALQNNAINLLENSQIQMLNPPFIMAMGYVCNDRAIAVALGDGTVRLLNARDLSFIASTEAHNGMVTSLYTVGQHVISGGVDKKVRIYEVAEGELQQSVDTINAPPSAGSAGVDALEKTTDSSVAVKAVVQIDAKPNCYVSNSSKKKKGRTRGRNNNSKSTPSPQFHLQPIHCVEHKHKINAVHGSIAWSNTADVLSTNARYVYVADVSNSISVYTMSDS